MTRAHGPREAVKTERRDDESCSAVSILRVDVYSDELGGRGLPEDSRRGFSGDGWSGSEVKQGVRSLGMFFCT